MFCQFNNDVSLATYRGQPGSAPTKARKAAVSLAFAAKAAEAYQAVSRFSKVGHLRSSRVHE